MGWFLNHLDGFHPVDPLFDEIADVHPSARKHLPHRNALRASVVEWWLVAAEKHLAILEDGDVELRVFITIPQGPI